MKPNKLLGLLFSILIAVTSCVQNEDLIADASSPKESPSTVSLEDARNELEKLLEDVYQSQSSRSMETDKSKKVIANAFTIKDEISLTRSSDTESPVIHIFNFENEEGFAIMSGNVGVPSLLALADSGEITETAPIDNPGFALFLENMEERYIDELTEYTSSANSNSHKVYGEWNNIVYK